MAASAPTTIDDDYVQKLSFKSRVPIVDQGGAVVTLNEKDADVHAVMAQTLPRYVIIQSNLNHLYVHLYKENPGVPNALRYTGDYSYGVDTRFEVVPATTGTGLVHIRSLENNLYWANTAGSGDNIWVTAMAAKPDQNQSAKHSTLFQPVFVYANNNSVLKLRHVNTGLFVTSFDGGAGNYDHALHLSPGNDDDSCTIIDWETVVMLPDVITMGQNDFHLRVLERTDRLYLYRDNNSPIFNFEVSPSRDGGIRLKSAFLGQYWTDTDPTGHQMILLRESSTSAVHDTNTVFLPTIANGNRIFIQSLASGKYCGTDAITLDLMARDKYVGPDDFWKIEEPVMSRKIYNVEYHLSDARFYNEKSVALVTDESRNRTPNPFQSELNLKHTVTNTTKWSTSVSFKVGVQMTLTFGIPFIESGELRISAEATRSHEWGEEETETLEVGSVKTVTVDPMTGVKGTLMATRISYDIPFSYTQYDIMESGTKKRTEKHDGIFTGNNGYGYQFEIVPVPLGDDEGDI